MPSPGRKPPAARSFYSASFQPEETTLLRSSKADLEQEIGLLRIHLRRMSLLLAQREQYGAGDEWLLLLLPRYAAVIGELSARRALLLSRADATLKNTQTSIYKQLTLWPNP